MQLSSLNEKINRESQCTNEKSHNCPKADTSTVIICSKPPRHLFALWSFHAMIEAGANRIGTSSAVEILKGAKA
jgi:hypothetical protein